MAWLRERAAGAIRVPRRSAFLLAPPGPYGPNGAAYAGSGSLWRRLESSLAYLSCFATGKSFFGGEEWKHVISSAGVTDRQWLSRTYYRLRALAGLPERLMFCEEIVCARVTLSCWESGLPCSPISLFHS